MTESFFQLLKRERIRKKLMPQGMKHAAMSSVTLKFYTTPFAGILLLMDYLLLDELGIDAGTYEWKWGTEQDGGIGDSVILKVIAPTVLPPAAATPVPTLGVFGLMGLAGAIGAAGVAMKRRRKASLN